MSTPTSPGPPSALRATWLITALAARRLKNRLLRARRTKSTGARVGTIRKRTFGGPLLLVLSALLFFNGFMQSTQLIHRLAVAAERNANPESFLVDHVTVALLDTVGSNVREYTDDDDEAAELHVSTVESVAARYVDHQRIRDEAERARRVAEFIRTYREHGKSGFRVSTLPAAAAFPSARIWVSADGARGMLLPLGLLTSILTIAVTILSSAAMNQEIAKVEWTLEWWFTFPVPARSLLLSRALETAFVNPLIWFVAFPFFASVFLCAGHGVLAPVLGMVATVYLGLLAGALRVAAETGLRRYWALRNVARIQAALSVVGMLCLTTTVLVSASPDLVAPLTAWAARLPAWAIMNPLNPMGLASTGAVGGTALACLGFGVLAVIGATRLGGWFVRDGLTTSTGPHGGSRRTRTSGAEPRFPLGAIARKELLLLSRDRSRLVQVFFSPLLLVGTQFALNRQYMSTVLAEPRRAASVAFVASGIALTTGGLHTLAADAPALWLYFTVPKRIERLFAQQALFWAALVSPIALGLFVAFTSMHSASIMKQAPLAAFLLIGVTLQALIVTALGVFGTDVLDSDPRRRVRPSIVYLSTLLVGIFAYAIYTPSAWTKVAYVVLFSLLVYALWEKVADHASLLLDPNEVPPPRLAVGDGVIAALAFFVGQGVFGFILITTGVPMAISLVYAFASSGLLVGAVALYTLWRSGLPDVARAVGLVMPRGEVLVGLATGIATGLSTGLVAWGYLAAVERFELLRPLRSSLDVISLHHAGALPWLVALVTIAAPIFEEFIFRGMLYGGFRRSVSPLRAALASALVFAVVHPVGSCFPVFVMGLGAALLYGRFRSLLVPVAVHMTYNAFIMALAFLR